MSEPEIVYTFTPQFDGAFLRGVPQRDLTQRDVNRMDAQQRRDAFGNHPLYGTPLYTAVGKDGDPPKWFQEKQAKAADGEVIEPILPNETKAAYEDRVAALNQPDDESPDSGDQDGDESPEQDGDA